MAGDLSTVASHHGAQRRIRWRSVLGAALVTASAFGVLFAHRAAQRPPEYSYLVVTSQVAAGTALEASHLGTVPIDLPQSVDAIPADRAPEVMGRLASHTLEPSALLAEADLVEPERFAIPGETEVAVSLDPTRTPIGGFGVGDRVSLLATDDTTTRALAESARVTRLDHDDETSIGSAARLRIGLALPDAESAREVIDAAVSEELTIVLGAPGQAETP